LLRKGWNSPTRGSRVISQPGLGLQAGNSRWRTARRRPRCSTRTGPIRFREVFAAARLPRAVACPSVLRPGGGRGATFPSVRPTRGAQSRLKGTEAWPWLMVARSPSSSDGGWGHGCWVYLKITHGRRCSIHPPQRSSVARAGAGNLMRYNTLAIAAVASTACVYRRGRAHFCDNGPAETATTCYSLAHTNSHCQ
jgi:hypothetical protein